MTRVIVYCSFVSTLLAQTVPPAKPPATLTVSQAVQEAIEHNLALMAERYNVSIAEARIVQARLRPNPVFSYGQDYQDVFGQGFTVENNAGPPEWNARVDFTLERGRKRQYRVAVADAARSVAQLQLLDSIRQLTLEVQDACVDVLLAKESLALAQENLKALEGIVAINTARVRAGDLADVELKRTQLAALQFQNSVKQAELRVRTAKAHLQLLLGRTTPSPDFDVTGPLREDRTMLVADELRGDARERRPDLLALQRDQARSQADIKLQIAQGKVDYSVGAMYHNQYGYSNGHAMGFFFSAPIPVFNRNQGEIERANREEAQLALRIRALQAQINNEVQTAYDQYLTSRNLVESIEKNMLQRAREVREVTDYSYRRGEASFVEFLDAQRAFNDTMQSYNEARGDYARNLYLIDAVSARGVNP